jgi:7 transmembrane helices usually fused to an inactive transglutaminase/Inactive transglutaminase fused to 7 transmembrane helices
MSRRHLYILVTVLCLAGILPFLYKTVVLGFPVFPAERAQTWRIELRAGFDGEAAPATLTLRVPRNTDAFTILNENYISPGYGLRTDARGDNRLAIFSIRRAQREQVIYFNATVHATGGQERPIPGPEPRFDEPTYEGAKLAAAQSLVRALERQSAGTATLVPLLIGRLWRDQPGGPATLLVGDQPTQIGVARAAVRMLSIAGVHARIVHGVALEPQRSRARLSHWIEVYDKGAWHPYDIRDGKPGRPPLHLPWWRGEEPLAQVTGGTDLRTGLSVSHTFGFQLQSAIERARVGHRAMIEYSTLGLPVNTQFVYRVLLTVPLGILLLVFLRNVIGLRTFGTFMPVLIGLAFRETELLWGLLLFSVVLAVGLAVRFYMETLRLLLVPRLGAVVIVVILIMAALSIVSHRLGFDRGLSVALFPIVILAMTIERMSIVWEELGPAESLRQAAGSLAVAALAHIAMTVPFLQHLVFVYPELLLIVLAATMLLGRYTGYRLTELPRFRAILERR